MAFDLGFLVQQLFALGLSGLVAAGVLIALRQARFLIEHPCRRSAMELLLVGSFEVGVGWSSELLLWGSFLPGEAIASELAFGMFFYWAVLFWPLRVFLQREELADTGYGGYPTTLASALVVVGLYGSLVEPHWLEVQKRQIEVQGLGRELRVAFVSDLHIADLGWRERQAMAAITDFEPDLLLLAGNLVDAGLWEAQATAAAREFVQCTEPSFGTFVIAGSGMTSDRQLAEALAGTDAQTLDDVPEIAPEPIQVGAESYLTITTDPPAGVPGWEDGGAAKGSDILLHFFPSLEKPDHHALVSLADRTTTDPWGSLMPAPVQVDATSRDPKFTALRSRGLGTPNGYAPPFRIGDRPQVHLITLIDR